MRALRLRWALPCVAAALLSACSLPAATVPQAGAHSPFVGYNSELYRDPARWLCRPDLATDVCRGHDVTDVDARGGRRASSLQAARPAAVDCFYVYPTVDHGLLPANHVDVADDGPAAAATLGQLAPFQSVCELFVPRYRQVTIGAYVFGGRNEARSRIAFSDVREAFLHYMGQYNRGRKVVLIGHSQGADMITRLLLRDFDEDTVMQARLLLAMPIGGPVEVPTGKRVGGTFRTLSLCSQPGESRCVIAYQSRVAGGRVTEPALAPRAGNEVACVNPASLSEPGAHRLRRSFFPVTNDTRSSLRGVDGIVTTFVSLPDFYTGECLAGPGGYSYLAIAAAPVAGDVRESAVDLSSADLQGVLGLHRADFQFPMGDLIASIQASVKAGSP